MRFSEGSGRFDLPQRTAGADTYQMPMSSDPRLNQATRDQQQPPTVREKCCMQRPLGNSRTSCRPSNPAVRAYRGSDRATAETCRRVRAATRATLQSDRMAKPPWTLLLASRYGGICLPVEDYTE